jgi:hypothetical protein
VEKIFFKGLTAGQQEAFSCLHNSGAVGAANMASKLPPAKQCTFQNVLRN